MDFQGAENRKSLKAVNQNELVDKIDSFTSGMSFAIQQIYLMSFFQVFHVKFNKTQVSVSTFLAYFKVLLSKKGFNWDPECKKNLSSLK